MTTSEAPSINDGITPSDERRIGPRSRLLAKCKEIYLAFELNWNSDEDSLRSRPFSITAYRNRLELWYGNWKPFESAYSATSPEQSAADLRSRYLQFARLSAKVEAENSVIRTLTIPIASTYFVITNSVVLIAAFTSDNPLRLKLLYLAGIGVAVLQIILLVRVVDPKGKIAAPLLAAYVSIFVGAIVILHPESLAVGDITQTATGTKGGTAVLMLGIATGGIIWMAGVLFTLGAAILMQRHSLRAAGPVAVDDLLDVVDLLSRTNRWDTTERQWVIHLMHRAAKTIRLGLPKSLALHTDGHQNLLRERCDKAANAIEEMELWVALPKKDTHQQASAVLCKIIAALLTGVYDELPQHEPIPISGTQRLHQAGKFLRTILIGAIPGLVFLGLKHLGIEASGGPANLIIIFCILWASVTYLSLLDPLMSQRLAMIRDLAETVKSGSELK
ncbi:hypothetical protein [Kribbella sp. NPDC023855]|uniref:hypothetical protein n=1 Tax=Kribbella sp. NPDC023855 TaxID=3154698 RepID=UPI0033FE1CBA